VPHVKNDYDYLYPYIKADNTVQRRDGEEERRRGGEKGLDGEVRS